MEAFSSLLAFCAGNSPTTGEFPTQKPVTWCFNILIYAWITAWVSNSEAGDLRRHRAYCDVIVIRIVFCCVLLWYVHVYFSHIPCQYWFTETNLPRRISWPAEKDAITTTKRARNIYIRIICIRVLIYTYNMYTVISWFHAAKWTITHLCMVDLSWNKILRSVLGILQQPQNAIEATN